MRRSPRLLLGLPIVSLLALPLAACSGNGTSSGGGAKSLTLYASGDVNVKSLYTKTLIPGFEKADPGYHVKLVFDQHGTNDTTTLARLAASVKQKAAPAMDLIDAGLVTSAAQSGLLAKVGTQQIPAMSAVDPNLLKPVNDSAVPYRASAVVLAYDSTKVQNPPKTFDDLISWIKNNPGKFTYNSPNTGGSGQGFVQTVLAKYMKPADAARIQYHYDPSVQKEWKQGLAKLKALGPSIYHHVYPNGNEAVVNLLSKGQIEMAPVWSDQATAAIESGLLGKDIKLAQVTDPQLVGSAAYLGIPVNSKKKAAAEKFAGYILSKDAQAAIVKQMSGYPVIPLSELPQSVQDKFGSLPTKHLRPGFEQKTASDANKAWQDSVA